MRYHSWIRIRIEDGAVTQHWFWRQAYSFPRATPEQEKAWWVRYCLEDVRAGQRLVCANLRRICWVVARMRIRTRMSELDDMFQEGAEASIRALDTWDGESMRFGSWIKFPVMRAAWLSWRNGISPVYYPIKVDPEPAVSMDEEIDATDITMHDLVGDERWSPGNAVNQLLAWQHDPNLLKVVVDTLDPIELDAIKGRFFEHRTYNEIALATGEKERALQSACKRGMTKLLSRLAIA